MRKMIARPRVAAASVAFAAAIAAIAQPAIAADPVEPALKAALQRDLRLSERQVAQYLRVEQLARQHEQALAKQEGRSFAGSWIERGADNTFRYVVATTSLAPRTTPAGVEYRQARRSLAELQSSKAQLDVVAQQRVPTGVYGWHVDVPTNSVVVSIARGAQRAGIDFVAASGADVRAVRFETMGSAPRPLATFQGGSEYLSNHDGSYYYCSVGFSVTHSTGQGFATAGHCGSAGDGAYYLVSRRTVSPIGSFAASVFPNADRAWVRVDNGHTLLPSVSGYGKGDVTVRGSTEAAIGAALCRSGRTTGWKCGVIEAKNVSVTYAEGTVNGMTRTNVCAEGGDSGGAFITSAGQGQGVLSGGNYSCKGNQASLAKSYFYPLNPLLQAYNLTLKTSP
jgi:streptogrisin C